VRLELDFPERFCLLQGQNAQGKTNLLEAIAYLATARSPHASQERELVNLLALEDPLPYARLVATVERHGELDQLDITLMPPNTVGTLAGRGSAFRKQVRVNGVNKRALDLIGRMPVVLFLPEDIDMVAGAPERRRRYLDVALCQMDPAYCSALAEYGKVLVQRNALLRTLRDRYEHGQRADLEQLTFWDEQMIRHGSLIIERRASVLINLQTAAQQYHQALTHGNEHLRLHYLPSFDPEKVPTSNGYQLGLQLSEAGIVYRTHPLSLEEVTKSYQAHLRTYRQREVSAGMSLVGPHRDDMSFTADGRDLRIYGSRGQQRTAALSLKLAEVEVMTHVIGEAPILLLDDVMSELDEQRRATLLDVLHKVPQAVITTTDLGDFGTEFQRQAAVLRVEGGRITPIQTQTSPAVSSHAGGLALVQEVSYE